MIPIDRYLLVRGASVYLAVTLTAVAWVWRRPLDAARGRPDRRAWSGAFLAAAWNVPTLLALHVAATRAGLWRFEASGGLFFGMPVELYLAWAWLWGAVPALAFPSLPIAPLVLIALAADLILMPAAAPVLRLQPGWLVAEAAGLALAFIPGQLLARWTARDERLVARATLQVVAFSGLMIFVLPAIIVAGSGSTWRDPLALPAWELSLAMQLLAIPAMLGLSAVQEFVTRGGGTPVPFDPPRRLVTTGPYAYVRNPMQLSAVVLLTLLGVVLRNPWIAAAGVMAHIYSAGLAGWDEDADLRGRFGDGWIAYRRGVRRWIPRLRPWQPPDRAPARLFVASGCGMCSEVGQWFARRQAASLVIVPADTHPSQALTRIAYEAADGCTASGVEAIARALEHVHLGWAALGFLLRLPVVRPMAQLLVDASGGEPRPVPALKQHAE
jgi:protein-S-isoprenylcysteine O-methyltransferase Ste14